MINHLIRHMCNVRRTDRHIYNAYIKVSVILCSVSQHDESSRVPHMKCNISLLFVPLQNLMEVCFEPGIGIQTLQIDSELSLDYIRFLLQQ